MHRLGPNITWWSAVIWSAASAIGLSVVLAGMEIDRTPTAQAGAANLRNLWPYWIASTSCWLGLSAMWMLLRRDSKAALCTVDSVCDRRGFGAAAIVILGLAMALRLIVLAWHEPALSDDVYRYVLDGRNVAAGVNPYLDSPAQRMEALSRGETERWPGEAELLARINNPQLHSVYLPVSQWSFGAAALAIGDRWSSPAVSARVFRFAFVLIELIAIGLILLALRKAGRSAWWAALYAWHPLALSEVAGSGHQDVMGIALLIAAIMLAARPAPANSPGVASYGRSPLYINIGAVLIAAASLVKPVALPALLLLLRGRRWRSWLLAAIIAAGVCVVLSAPLLLTHDREPLATLNKATERMAMKWAHFGSMYEPLLWMTERAAPAWTNDQQEILARRICAALLIVIIAVVVFQRNPSSRCSEQDRLGDIWRRARIVLVAMVLLSPVAHPWYLLWALALGPMSMSASLWVLSLTLPWGYAVLGDVEQWRVSPWVMAAAYAPVYMALAFEIVLHCRRLRLSA